MFLKVKKTPLEITTMKTGKRIANPNDLDTYQPPKKRGKRATKSATASNQEEKLLEEEQNDEGGDREERDLPTSVERVSRRKAISEAQVNSPVSRPQAVGKTKRAGKLKLKGFLPRSKPAPAGKPRSTATKARSAKRKPTAQCEPNVAKKPIETIAKVSKEKRDNIAASFHLSLKNKGLSTEFQKTKR